MDPAPPICQDPPALILALYYYGVVIIHSVLFCVEYYSVLWILLDDGCDSDSAAGGTSLRRESLQVLESGTSKPPRFRYLTEF